MMTTKRECHWTDCNRANAFSATAFLNSKACLRLSVTLLAGSGFLVTATAKDWPMFGRDKTRNAVNPEKNPPIKWDVKTGLNIKWKAQIGSFTFATPVVANGLVWIG